MEKTSNSRRSHPPSRRKIHEDLSTVWGVKMPDLRLKENIEKRKDLMPHLLEHNLEHVEEHRK